MTTTEPRWATTGGTATTGYLRSFWSRHPVHLPQQLPATEKPQSDGFTRRASPAWTSIDRWSTGCVRSYSATTTRHHHYKLLAIGPISMPVLSAERAHCNLSFPSKTTYCSPPYVPVTIRAVGKSFLCNVYDDHISPLYSSIVLGIVLTDIPLYLYLYNYIYLWIVIIILHSLPK